MAYCSTLSWRPVGGFARPADFYPQASVRGVLSTLASCLKFPSDDHEAGASFPGLSLNQKPSNLVVRADRSQGDTRFVLVQSRQLRNNWEKSLQKHRPALVYRIAQDV